MKLKFGNPLTEGGFVSQAPNQDAGHTDRISTVYISDKFRKRFGGVFICQVQSEQELPDGTFIMVGWEAPLFGSARFYTVLVETRYGEVRWEPRFMRDQHRLFHNRLRKYTGSIAEAWSLGNNAKIKLITDLGGDKDYNIKITIHEDEPDYENTNFPVRIAS
jgi:hypothetical protein